jgi:hypothetical protein
VTQLPGFVKCFEHSLSASRWNRAVSQVRYVAGSWCLVFTAETRSNPIQSTLCV